MSIRLEYREAETDDLYILDYRQSADGVWRIYADEHPHNPYDEAVTSCHLYSSGEVCVDHNKFVPRTLDEAKACAYLWMEGYSQYVPAPVSFRQPAAAFVSDFHFSTSLTGVTR